MRLMWLVILWVLCKYSAICGELKQALSAKHYSIYPIYTQRYILLFIVTFDWLIERLY